MDFNKLTVKTAAEALKGKEISVSELTESYFKKIENTDKNINAFISTNKEKALADARAAQVLIENGKGGILTGIPMAVKDNMCTEGTRTTCASRMLVNFNPPYTSTAVNKLKHAWCRTSWKTQS